MKFSSDQTARPPDAPIFSAASPSRPRRLFLPLAFGCAFAALSACQSAPRTQPASNSAASAQQPSPKPTPEPEVQIYEDEAMLRGSQAVLGGTVENLSGARLENLKLELELQRRGDEATEKRTVEVKPAVLAP